MQFPAGDYDARYPTYTNYHKLVVSVFQFLSALSFADIKLQYPSAPISIRGIWSSVSFGGIWLETKKLFLTTL